MTSFAYFSTKWLTNTYGFIINTEQILFHIYMNTEGLIGTDSELIKSVIVQIVALPILVAFSFFLLLKFIDKPKIARKGLIYTYLFIVPLFFIVGYQSIKLLKIDDFVISLFGEDVFSNAYVDPKNIIIKERRANENIILIYVESLENNFSRLKFDKNSAISPIEELPGVHVKNFYQAPGTGWSIAGMISSQCSIPIKRYTLSDIRNANNDKNMPNLICLGDILRQAGYIQSFFVGPDLKFTGMDKFYKTHKYDQAFGRDELKAHGASDRDLSGWGEGAHDDYLFDFAKSKIDGIKKTGKPFAVTIITTDTHGPNGFPSPNCTKHEIESNYAGTLYCTSRDVNKFINSILNDPILSQTNILLMGDHLSWVNPEGVLGNDIDRRIYLKIYSPHNRIPTRDSVTHFDIAPTILDLLGLIENSNQQFGLGLSVYADGTNYDMTLNRNLSTSILNRSSSYDELWSASEKQIQW